MDGTDRTWFATLARSCVIGMIATAAFNQASRYTKHSDE